jgi:hypothetical protein
MALLSPETAIKDLRAAGLGASSSRVQGMSCEANRPNNVLSVVSLSPQSSAQLNGQTARSCLNASLGLSQISASEMCHQQLHLEPANRPSPSTRLSTSPGVPWTVSAPHKSLSPTLSLPLSMLTAALPLSILFA